MDVYLKRAYSPHPVQASDLQENYPFWDYRSCRHNATKFSPENTEDDGTSLTDCAEMPGHPNNHKMDDVTFGPTSCPVTLHIITDPQQGHELFDLYQQAINWVDPRLELFRVTERNNALCQSHQHRTDSSATFTDTPAIAMTIFLRGTDEDGDDSDGLEKAPQLFHHPPWRLHHRETLGPNKLNSVANNSYDFYYTSRELPLWSARHVHYGQEHVRYVLYVSETTWTDQVDFYTRVLNIEADLVREDFCLFTVFTQDSYDVQLALKKLDPDLHILRLHNVQIHIKVKDTGSLVPLLPNVCRPVSDVLWQTTDHDGNVVVIDTSQVHPATNNISTQNTTRHSSEHPAKLNHHIQFTDNQLKKQSRLKKKKTMSKLEITVPEELDLRLMTTGQFDSLITSDFDDLGIDLPSPPLRNMSRPEEDEESLTLTNTSEESGIQMQSGCDDFSFCEDEGLRSCLSKNSFLKVRHVKFKVRFREEVQTFQDPPSLCSDGDDQSVAEMETRFPYLPPSEQQPRQCEGINGQTTGVGAKRELIDSYGQLCSDFHAIFPHNGPCLAEMTQLPQMYSIRGQDRVSHPTTRNNSLAKKAPSELTEATCSRQQTTSPLHLAPGLTCCPSPNIYNCSVAHNRHNVGHSMGPCCSYPQCPDYRSCECFQPPTSNTKHRTAPPHEFTNTCPRSSRELTPVSDCKAKHTINRTASNRTIQHKERPPCTSLAADKSKPFCPPFNSQENKAIADKRQECNPCSQMQHVENGQKRFWFADTNLDLAQNGCSGQEESALKFTLKYDTCPTSGRTSSQEQIGFYV